MRTIKAIVPALAGVSSTVTKEQMIFTRMYFLVLTFFLFMMKFLVLFKVATDVHIINKLTFIVLMSGIKRCYYSEKD